MHREVLCDRHGCLSVVEAMDGRERPAGGRMPGATSYFGFYLAILGCDVQDVRMPRSAGMRESGLPRSRESQKLFLACFVGWGESNEPQQFGGKDVGVHKTHSPQPTG